MSADEVLKADGVQNPEPRLGVDARNTFSGLHAGVTDRVLSVFFEVYNELGGGFLESVYQQALRIAFEQAGLKIDAEVAVPVHFRGHLVGSFRADLVVNQCVLLELKAVTPPKQRT